MDKRLLISRSEYFKEMLSEPKWKEARTNIIDLRPGDRNSRVTGV